MPGLVGASEIESLKQQISDASLGGCFILQGGDCAERFQDCREGLIRGKMRILMQMALVMGYALRVKWTRDPGDRVIVANAMANNDAPLITSDRRIQAEYPNVIW